MDGVNGRKQTSNGENTYFLFSNLGPIPTLLQTAIRSLLYVIFLVLDAINAKDLNTLFFQSLYSWPNILSSQSRIFEKPLFQNLARESRATHISLYTVFEFSLVPLLTEQ
jgi:hypothetical protein